MDYEIEHRQDYHFIMFREDFLAVCLKCKYKKQGTSKTKSKASPYCKAIMLSILEQWEKDKREKGQDLATYMTQQQWIAAMYGMFGRCVIIDSIDELVGEGLVSREAYTAYGKSMFKYRLNVSEINKRIKDLPAQEKTMKEQTAISEGMSKNRQDVSTSRQESCLKIDSKVSKNRHNIDTTKIHDIDSNKERDNQQLTQPQETKEPKVPSPSFQQKNTSVLSTQAQAIIALWEEIEGEPVLLTKKIIDAALALEKVNPTKEQLMECKYFCLSDNPEWYKTHGLDLASIANNWAKWRSKCKMTNANTTRASTTATVKLQAATPGSQYIVDELVSRSEDNLSAWLATPEGQKAMQEAEEEEQRHAQQALTITLSKTSVSGMQNFTFEPEPVPVLSNAPRTGKLYIKRPSHATTPEQSADFDTYKKKRDEEERQALIQRGISNIGQGQPGLYDPVW